MEDPIVGMMSVESKEWFARAVVGMIWADGRIDKAEIEYLKSVLGFLKDKDLIHTVLGMIKKNDVPKLQPLHLDKPQAVTILKHLTSLSIVDENLDKAEEEFLISIGALLNLPKEVPIKFIELAKKRLKGNRFTGNLLVGEDSLDVICFGFSESECMFFSDRLVNPLARLTLMMYKDQQSKSKSEFFAPFVAEAQWCRAVKSGIGKFVIKAVFKKKITSAEGARLVLSLPEGQQSKTSFEPNFNSLMGIYVQCRVCGTNDIPFWQLKTKSLHAKKNIFGIACYDKALEEKDFCDYNLYQVSVCPNCLFASNSIDYFQRQDKAAEVSLFDPKLFNTKWQPSIHNRKRLIRENDNWLYEKYRNTENAIISYQLAIATHKQLGLMSDDLEQSNHQRKIATFILTEAEILMSQGEKTEARKLVQSAKTQLLKTFESCERETAIKTAQLIVLISIYFKEYDDVGEYLNFLQKYDRIHTVTPGSREARILNFALEITKDAWQDRKAYAFDWIRSFHLRS